MNFISFFYFSLSKFDKNLLLAYQNFLRITNKKNSLLNGFIFSSISLYFSFKVLDLLAIAINYIL